VLNAARAQPQWVWNASRADLGMSNRGGDEFAE
jgi:hypothetical protein